jgi:hypothetical protein
LYSNTAVDQFWRKETLPVLQCFLNLDPERRVGSFVSFIFIGISPAPAKPRYISLIYGSFKGAQALDFLPMVFFC